MIGLFLDSGQRRAGVYTHVWGVLSADLTALVMLMQQQQ
jgi:hypothetical protein